MRAYNFEKLGSFFHRFSKLLQFQIAEKLFFFGQIWQDFCIQSFAMRLYFDQQHENMT
jgi:hypothetical protein